MVRVLALVGNPTLQLRLEEIRAAEGVDLVSVGSIAETQRAFHEHSFAVLLIEVGGPASREPHAIMGLIEAHPGVAVLLVADEDFAGAANLYTLPVRNYLGWTTSHPVTLKLALRRAVEHRYSQLEHQLLREQQGLQWATTPIIAEEPVTREIFELARKLASTRWPVLITGEPGTGKQLLGRWIHEHSSRRHRPFLVVSPAEWPLVRLEQRVFGHTPLRGSENSPCTGWLEQADGGTLYLRDVTALPLEIQQRIVLLIDHGSFRRPDHGQQVRVDLRVIAASRKDPEVAVREGCLSGELYNRLAAWTISMPPLRARTADIPRLAQAFLEQAARRWRTSTPELSTEALARLLEYPWPGNLHELRNVMEHVVFYCGDVVAADDLPLPAPWALARPLPLKELERLAVEQALARNHGNRIRAARELGISVRKLQYCLKRYRLSA